MKCYFAVLNTGSANTLIKLPCLSELDGSLLVRISLYMYVLSGSLQQLSSDTFIFPAAAPRSQSALLLLPRHTSPGSHNPTAVASRDHLMYTCRTVRVISGLNSQPLTVISPLELQQTHTHMDFSTKDLQDQHLAPVLGAGTMNTWVLVTHSPTPVAAPWAHGPCDLWSGCYTDTPCTVRHAE